jgi:hypothetical protein
VGNAANHASSLALSWSRVHAAHARASEFIPSSSWPLAIA